MSFSVEIKGVKLSQEQLDAIIPVLNSNPPRKRFETLCLAAMEEAGCPFEKESEECEMKLSRK
jgi:hypothetical protein